MKTANRYTGSVRLVDKKARVVEVLGPAPLGSRRPSDRKLLFWGTQIQRDYMRGPQSVGLCFAADGRKAKFILDRSVEGDQLLDLLSKYPNAPSRLAKPYGPTGWVVED